jgi:CARDB protein
MLRFALITVLAALLLTGTAAAAGPASVTLTACTPKERTAAFEARMDQISGAVRMKLRYTLEARKPGRLWRRVAAPELGSWRTASAETTRYISERRVTQLVGPSSYRALVRFRWIDADGHVVARARSRSHVCWQPDHRPNIKLRELSFEGKGSYVALVANTGRTPTGAFDLEITGLAPIVVPELAPGEERLIEATGPECEPGAAVTATADPLNLIDERSERDNAVTRRCPGRAS